MSDTGTGVPTAPSIPATDAPNTNAASTDGVGTDGPASGKGRSPGIHPSGNKNKRGRHHRRNNSNSNSNNNNNNNNNSNNSKKKHSGSSGSSAPTGRGNHARQPNHGKSNGKSKSSHQKPLSDKKLSHSLSWALRHAAPDLGLSIRPDGFVPVRELLDSTHPKLRGATLEAIRRVVEHSDKQRFRLEDRPGDLYLSAGEGQGETVLCIRANQGHSISTIDPELLLTRIPPETLRSLPRIVHGTNPLAWESILRDGGLRKMNRTHIHFAPGLPSETSVVSGMRKTASVYIYLDAEKCAKESRIDFFRSDNGVLLTDGVGDSGVLPVEFFSHATDSSGEILLDNRTKPAT